jgi:hypothetical protein
VGRPRAVPQCTSPDVGRLTGVGLARSVAIGFRGPEPDRQSSPPQLGTLAYRTNRWHLAPPLGAECHQFDSVLLPVHRQGGRQDSRARQQFARFGLMPFLPAEVLDAGGQGDCRRGQRRGRNVNRGGEGRYRGFEHCPVGTGPTRSRADAFRIRPAPRSNSGDPVPDRGTRMRKFTRERAAAADRPIFVFATGCDCAGELASSVGRERRGRRARRPLP